MTQIGHSIPNFDDPLDDPSHHKIQSKPKNKLNATTSSPSSELDKKTLQLTKDKISYKTTHTDLDQRPENSVKQKGAEKYSFSAFFKGKTPTLPNLSQLFGKPAQVQVDGAPQIESRKSTDSFSTIQNNTTVASDTIESPRELGSELSFEWEGTDPDTVISSLSAKVASAKEDTVLLKPGQSIQQALVAEKQTDAKQKLQALSHLQEEIASCKDLAKGPFSFEKIYTDITNKIGTIEYTDTPKENKITNLCNRIQFSFSVLNRHPLFSERAILRKELSTVVHKDTISVDLIKSQREKLQGRENSAVKQVRLDFLDLKQLILETRLEKAKQLENKILKQIDTEKRLFKNLGTSDAKNLYERTWYELSSTLYSLPVEQKAKIMNQLDTTIYDHDQIIKPMRQLLFTTEGVEERLSAPAVSFLLDTLKAVSRDIR